MLRALHRWCCRSSSKLVIWLSIRTAVASRARDVTIPLYLALVKPQMLCSVLGPSLHRQWWYMQSFINKSHGLIHTLIYVLLQTHHRSTHQWLSVAAPGKPCFFAVPDGWLKGVSMLMRESSCSWPGVLLMKWTRACMSQSFSFVTQQSQGPFCSHSGVFKGTSPHLPFHGLGRC